jgi:hypothetical protein
MTLIIFCRNTNTVAVKTTDPIKSMGGRSFIKYIVLKVSRNVLRDQILNEIKIIVEVCRKLSNYMCLIFGKRIVIFNYYLESLKKKKANLSKDGDAKLQV